jgi:hypothetical protein
LCQTEAGAPGAGVRRQLVRSGIRSEEAIFLIMSCRQNRTKLFNSLRPIHKGTSLTVVLVSEHLRLQCREAAGGRTMRIEPLGEVAMRVDVVKNVQR